MRLQGRKLFGPGKCINWAKVGLLSYLFIFIDYQLWEANDQKVCHLFPTCHDTLHQLEIRRGIFLYSLSIKYFSFFFLDAVCVENKIRYKWN